MDWVVTFKIKYMVMTIVFAIKARHDLKNLSLFQS